MSIEQYDRPRSREKQRAWDAGAYKAIIAAVCGSIAVLFAVGTKSKDFGFSNFSGVLERFTDPNDPRAREELTRLLRELNVQSLKGAQSACENMMLRGLVIDKAKGIAAQQGGTVSDALNAAGVDLNAFGSDTLEAARNAMQELNDDQPNFSLNGSEDLARRNWHQTAIPIDGIRRVLRNLDLQESEAYTTEELKNLLLKGMVRSLGEWKKEKEPHFRNSSKFEAFLDNLCAFAECNNDPHSSVQEVLALPQFSGIDPLTKDCIKDDMIAATQLRAFRN